jgi:CheY-like chemotaxis protein
VVTGQPVSREIDASRADVLIVEDDTEGRETLLDFVQQLGFVAIAAADGVEALQLARERSPRLILLDLEMPVMNGWQFLEHRRLEPALALIPVVITSAAAGELAGRPDVQGRLDKPLRQQPLRELLRAFLAPPPAPAEMPPAPDPAILVVEDDDDTRVSISELLEEHGYRVIHARDGRDAEAHLLARRPACIVLDLWMPLMDGWTFAARLQGRDGPPIPTVVVTAAGPHWGYPVPQAQVLRKPLRSDAFLALIREMVATGSAASRSSARA